MKKIIIFTFLFTSVIVNGQMVNPFKPDNSGPANYPGMALVFSDEFNYTGKPDSVVWNYEIGFVRNKELQWYQCDNANCSNGRLLIEGKKAEFENPNYEANSQNWKTNRKTVNYTSACISTKDKKAWKFGRFEIRARIDTAEGAWPAIWTIGIENEWPWCGEVDILEFYRPQNRASILANVASGSTVRWQANWRNVITPLSNFTDRDKDWPLKYHVWRMDWNKDSLNIYLDDKLLNSTLLSQTVNPDGTNPLLQAHYLLLNLALGENGGNPAQSKFPITFEVDYVRIYQQL